MARVSRRIKLPKRKRMFNGYLKNDLEYLDRVTLKEKIHSQSHLSILYLTLLISSVLVCTLGLLTNSSAIVIGGMLIAPLLWPLARLGFGIAHRTPHHLTRGFGMVMVSVFVGTAAAYFITVLSPIKVINEEILARTAPTLMDLFIALVAGLVAAIAITQKKISDSLAGVAIAVSLMPPLCTVGIALGLRNLDLSLGALILFTVNAACITLVTSAVFIWTQHARHERVKVAAKAAAINVIFILILAVPLVNYLRNYSFELRSYESITTHMDGFIDNKDPAADFENIVVGQDDTSTLIVSADLLLPSGVAFSYEDNEALIAELERIVGKDILLNIRIQSIIEPISKDQQEDSNLIKSLNESFSLRLKEIDNSYQINSISVAKDNQEKWVINADVLTSPDAVPTSDTVSKISTEMSEVFELDIDVNVTFLPRLTLRSSDQSIIEEAQTKVEEVTLAIDESASVSSLVVNSVNEDRSSVQFNVTTSDTEAFTNAYLEILKFELERVFSKDLSINVNLIATEQIGI